MSRAPFRSDEVGSLLRPEAVHRARAERAAGRIDATELREVEDTAILAAVDAQHAVGLSAVTDGEFRRAFWHFDFFGGLDGVEIVHADSGMAFQGTAPAPLGVRITDRVAFPSDHPMLEHFRFLRDAVGEGAVAKQCIPSPTVLHFRLAPGSSGPYADRDALFADLATAWRAAIRAFADAGCTYLQLDDTAWAYLCSGTERERARQRGIDPDGLADAYADLLAEVLRDRPDGMTITTHVCRGNFRSTWIASGGYEPVAPALLGRVPYDGFFLEYDSARAGGFEPLRHLADGDSRVVLGLVTTKSGALEDRHALRARIAEAARFVPIERLAVSPQCGFASTAEGNLLTEDEQWAKLREVVAVAREVWT